MDETDFQILVHLVRNPFDRIEAVARAVRLSRGATARRIRIMETSPLKLQYFCYPHPRLFGLHSRVVLFRTTGPVDVARILAVPSVMACDVNHDGLCAVTVWSPRADSPVPEELARLLGGLPVARLQDATPGPKHPHLSRMEWRIARALMDGPRRTAKELAAATGLAAGTCTRHRRRLAEAKFVVAGITFQEDRSGGFPVFRAYVQGRFDRTAVLAALGDGALVSDSVEEGHVILGRAESLGDVLVRVERVRRRAGVSDVTLILSRDNGIAYPWLRALIREKEAELARPRPGSGS